MYSPLSFFNLVSDLRISLPVLVVTSRYSLKNFITTPLSDAMAKEAATKKEKNTYAISGTIAATCRNESILNKYFPPNIPGFS
ncbi:hypothetical protein GCM10007047_33940 [Cerasicoccus arenae]|uniref:Uncharacterized protein n=1 Tax=Cerasicoccus arenae TaxID=424488 RepID=A0A8J3DDF1_9BACT|nr:hypothetical protein GCM10007047_33940 [Cerasicoccus arenae]